MDHDAPQCGFCTSGQLMSAKAVLNAHPHPTRDEVRAGHDRQHLPLFELQPLCGGDAGGRSGHGDPKITMIDNAAGENVQPMKTSGTPPRASTPASA